MLKDSFHVLEYFRLLNIISNFAQSSLGKDYCLALRPIYEHEDIENRLRLLSEFRELINVKGWVSIDNISSVVKYLDKANIKGWYLTPDEILLIKRLLENAFNVKHFVIEEGKEYKRLVKLVNSIPDSKYLLKLLRKSISDNGIIKDSASIILKRIREKKSYYRDYIRKKLEKILAKSGISEFNISIRDGRYVVGLNSNKKGNIRGIFHGYSQSKATSFVEPAQIVEENNKIAELEIEEKDEEIRILRNITEQIKKFKHNIEKTQSLLGKIDSFYAQAKFCNLLSCNMPEICKDNVIDIKQAKNPILAYLSINGDTDCIPVNLSLSAEKNILIISGPNRGGKTVALKTLGLLVLMTQSGLHIPAEEGSKLRIFKKILAEIGDDQNIETGLSTFSAHIEHLKKIVEDADHDTLIIMDEPGMGTDPLEGASISMAILDYLIEKGSFIAISTHFNRLKLYGINNKRVKSASVEFDSNKGIPTYRLIYGSPGISMGFEIAKTLGMPDYILIKAKDYCNDNEFKLTKIMAELSDKILSLEKEKAKLLELKSKYQELYEDIKSKKESIISAARNQAELVIKNAKKELRDAIIRLKKKKSPPGEIVNKVSDITKDLIEKFERSDKQVNKKMVQLKEGQIIYHKGLKQKGVVLTYDSTRKNAFISLGSLRMWADLVDVEIIEEEDSKFLSFRESDNEEFDRTFMPEINIIGYKVDDALPVIDKAIDKAILNGNSAFKIIHGIGTGRLRRAIRDYLKTMPQVKQIKNAPPEMGGNAITIVELL